MDFTYKNSSSRKNKIIALIILSILLLVGILIGSLAVVNQTSNSVYAKNVENIGPSKDGLIITQAKDSTTGYATIKNNKENKPLRILHLTDTHIGRGLFSIRKDRLAFESIRKTIYYSKPDLIIVTGDMVYPVPFQSGTLNNKRETLAIGNFLEAFGIPWTITFGNHDTEVYATHSVKEISDIYENKNDGRWKNCLYTSDHDENVFGTSNHIINVENYDGTLNTSLVMIDSNKYVKGSISSKYDKIRDDQCLWYIDNMNKITIHYNGVARSIDPNVKEITDIYDITRDNIAKSLAFFHIPVREFDRAWKALKNKDSENLDDTVKYGGGLALEKGEAVDSPYRDEGNFYDFMLENGSCKAMFVGHDHRNYFNVQYNSIPDKYGKDILRENPIIKASKGEIFDNKFDSRKFDNGGIWLCYGKSIDYLAYFRIRKQHEQRGGNVIELLGDGNFTYEQTRSDKM